jgi:hypothetical protein
MSDLPGFATAPHHVRGVDFGHVLVLVDYRSGRVLCLPPEAGRLWSAAAESGRADAVPAALYERLVAQGLLVPASRAVPWPPPVRAPQQSGSWGSTEHPAGVGRPQGRQGVAGAAAALAVVQAVQRAGRPHRAIHRLIRLTETAAKAVRRPASAEQARDAVTAVRRAAWYAPGRAACLEESAAAALLLASRRLGVAWCHGVAADPVRLHAWVQTGDGQCVAEPESGRAYTALLTVGNLGARHQHQP